LKPIKGFEEEITKVNAGAFVIYFFSSPEVHEEAKAIYQDSWMLSDESNFTVLKRNGK